MESMVILQCTMALIVDIGLRSIEKCQSAVLKEVQTLNVTMDNNAGVILFFLFDPGQ